ncbi:SMP-30/gluconolactonase/LRE family protein [Nonomuraea guangzhouensis]|uniref:SMP-30/gluconolactonase/LRE family protein n=1 Tax=Nonomuraea guangzhouensis TaxID=1291555 RepID=A0ABW4GAA6_9ACTN|nr:SMP-30/gluconolactonase/LRE family protein [Nonomuraea guangzhouensis]
MISTPQPVTGAGSLLGEGPIWDEDAYRLLWVDIWGGLLHATSPEGETTSTDLGAPLSSVVLSTRGTRVVTAGLCVLELTGEGARHLADIPEDPCMRANDAAVDPAGRLWIGTMTMPHRPTRPGGLWRLDPGSHVPVRILDDVRLANGLAWSPSGDTLYFVDSLRQEVNAYAFDPAEGSIGALPTRFPMSCAFGGPDLRELFITTGSRPVAPDERPGEISRGAGALFRFGTGVRGLPASRMEL